MSFKQINNLLNESIPSDLYSSNEDDFENLTQNIHNNEEILDDYDLEFYVGKNKIAYFFKKINDNYIMCKTSNDKITSVKEINSDLVYWKDYFSNNLANASFLCFSMINSLKNHCSYENNPENKLNNEFLEFKQNVECIDPEFYVSQIRETEKKENSESKNSSNEEELITDNNISEDNIFSKENIKNVLAKKLCNSASDLMIYGYLVRLIDEKNF